MRAWRLAVTGCVGLAASFATALVDLDLRTDVVRTRKGAEFTVRLYAVSDSLANQPVGALDVLFQWDPRRVRMDGYTNSGSGYNWFSSGWLYPDGPNRDRTDGDAIWTGIARPGNPAYATPLGLLVTTFRFTALTNFRSSLIPIMPGQDPYRSVVYDGFDPTREVTGNLDTGVVVTTLDDKPPGSQGMPEPATVAALGTGLAMLAARLRRLKPSAHV